jgi:conjugal transfer/entry exclusion protein
MQVTKQTTNTMSNLATLNQTAQEIANALGTIDLDLLQKVHDLVTGKTSCCDATDSDETLSSPTAVS